MCRHGVQLWLCGTCIDEEILEMLSEEGPELISSYHARIVAVCECGSKKLGVEDFAPGHSAWCPVAVNP